MTKPVPASPPPMSPNPIPDGDALARDSQWRAAVSQWVDGYAYVSAAERSARARRVRWVLRECGTPISEHNREQEERRKAYRILLLGMVFGAIATTMIVVGTYAENGTSPLLAVGGWIGIVASSACAVIYVFRLHRASDLPDHAPLSNDEITRAQALAETIDRESAGPRHAGDH